MVHLVFVGFRVAGRVAVDSFTQSLVVRHSGCSVFGPPSVSRVYPALPEHNSGSDRNRGDLCRVVLHRRVAEYILVYSSCLLHSHAMHFRRLYLVLQVLRWIHFTPHTSHTLLNLLLLLYQAAIGVFSSSHSLADYLVLDGTHLLLNTLYAFAGIYLLIYLAQWLHRLFVRLSPP